jgi:methionyl aminopeptidase
MANSQNRNRRRGSKRFAEGMRAAGKLAYLLLEELEGFIEPGVTTEEIDQLVDRLTFEAGALSAPFGYQGFPAHCCTSVNEVICHGIPSDRVLVSGDIINVDVTPKLHGYHGDSSRMFCVGEVSDEAGRLVSAAYECMWLGIKAVRPGCPVDVVGQAIQPYAEAEGFSVVKQFTGHGTGKTFHKDPPIPHMIVKPGNTALPTLKVGTAFTIEPMINAGGWEAKVLEDGWTAVTADESLSAQWEHTLLVTREGIEVVTAPGRFQ